MQVIDDARPPFRSGSIYAIVNTVTWRTYVGATAGSATRRISSHVNLLRRSKGVSKHLQADWNTYGESAFLGGLIESVNSVADLPSREAFWLSEMQRQGIALYNYHRGPVYSEALAQSVIDYRAEQKRRSRERRRQSGGAADAD